MTIVQSGSQPWSPSLQGITCSPERDVGGGCFRLNTQLASTQSRQSNPIEILTLCHLWSLPFANQLCTQNFILEPYRQWQRQQPGLATSTPPNSGPLHCRTTFFLQTNPIFRSCGHNNGLSAIVSFSQPAMVWEKHAVQRKQKRGSCANIGRMIVFCFHRLV